MALETPILAAAFLTDIMAAPCNARPLPSRAGSVINVCFTITAMPRRLPKSVARGHQPRKQPLMKALRGSVAYRESATYFFVRKMEQARPPFDARLNQLLKRRFH